MCDGTYNVLEAAHAHGVKKFVTASSASIYGLADDLPDDGGPHPYNNRTCTARAKSFSRACCGRSTTCTACLTSPLRYFNVYGPRMDIHGNYTEVLIRWMERIAAGQPPLIFGDGMQTMDFVYIDDVARANILALQSDQPTTSSTSPAVSRRASRSGHRAASRSWARNLKPEYGPERKVNPVSRRLADTTAAEKHLGFRAEVDRWTRACASLVDWWQIRSATEAAA